MFILKPQMALGEYIHNSLRSNHLKSETTSHILSSGIQVLFTFLFPASPTHQLHLHLPDPAEKTLWISHSNPSTAPRRRTQLFPSLYPPGAARSFLGGSDGKESACSVGDLGLMPGLGRSLEEGIATQSGILAWRIPMDRRAWWVTVHEVPTTEHQSRAVQCRDAYKHSVNS